MSHSTASDPTEGKGKIINYEFTFRISLCSFPFYSHIVCSRAKKKRKKKDLSETRTVKTVTRLSLNHVCAQSFLSKSMITSQSPLRGESRIAHVIVTKCSSLSTAVVLTTVMQVTRLH